MSIFLAVVALWTSTSELRLVVIAFSPLESGLATSQQIHNSVLLLYRVSYYSQLVEYVSHGLDTYGLVQILHLSTVASVVDVEELIYWPMSLELIR